MKIDVFNHFYPKRFYDQYVNLGASFKDMGKRVQAIGHIADIDQRLRAMDEWPDLRQVLTLPQPPVETLAGPDKTPEMAKIANDGFAELVPLLMERGARPAEPDALGRTAADLAAAAGHTCIVEALLVRGKTRAQATR